MGIRALILIIATASALPCVADQKWSFYGCSEFLPDDVDVELILTIFRGEKIADDGDFIQSLKNISPNCYQKQLGVNFKGYTEVDRKDNFDVKNAYLTCSETSISMREKVGSSNMKYQSVSKFGFETYYKIEKEHIESRNNLDPDAISRYKIVNVDSLFIKAQSTEPWGRDEKNLIKYLNKYPEKCYIACTSKTEILINRESLNVVETALDESGKPYIVSNYACKKSRPTI